MPNRTMILQVGFALLVCLTAGIAMAADRPLAAAGGGRPLGLQDRESAEMDASGAWGRPVRPHGRPVNGGPGYVGSDYGLGKPAFTGLGSRPDWGFSE